MRVVLLGNRDDARGFALAGVDTRTCASAADVERAASEMRAPQQPGIGVVLVTEEVYGLAPNAVERIETAGAWPIVIRLPAPDGEGHDPARIG